MKKTFTLLIMICGLLSVLSAQKTLTADSVVNVQITGPGVYTVEAGQFYAFDGRIDLIHDITIQGPDLGWIKDAEEPPVLVQTAGLDGDRRNFFEIKEGGKLTMKNLIISGTHNNGEIVKDAMVNTGGAGIVLDNCVMTDWEDFAVRNQNTAASIISVTNCVFMNGMRVRFSQWGGFPVRLDVGADSVTFENNTVVNSGRLLANNGPFIGSQIHQVHNTYLNQIVAGEELRATEFINANNIYHNYHFIGYRTETHSSPDNVYGTYWTGFTNFAVVEDRLDSVSLFFGSNLFYRPQEITDWYDTFGGDTLAASLLWEHGSVDSFALTDDNFKVGANYFQVDPRFTNPPDNIDIIVDNINAQRFTPEAEWIDWRVPQPVSWGDDGRPVLAWPPAFDLSYDNATMQTAGTDGLALGDLNWYPEQKADYEENRETYINDLRDSIANATFIYDPLAMDGTPMITELNSSTFNQKVPADFFIAGNYPNPFDQLTTIKFELHEQADVTLSVVDLMGRKVFEQRAGRMTSGSQQINFESSELSSGVYLYRISATDLSGKTFVLSKKMILSK